MNSLYFLLVINDFQVLHCILPHAILAVLVIRQRHSLVLIFFSVPFSRVFLFLVGITLNCLRHFTLGLFLVHKILNHVEFFLTNLLHLALIQICHELGVS